MTPALHFTQFGRYEIIRKLGRSMTDVYLALDPAANRRVVLKIVEQCRDPVTQAVLDAERRGALIQQQLHTIDARILEIYETGEQDGCFFVAMQYAEGRSLAEMLRREGRLDPMRAARYAAEVASQLQTLHSFQAEIDGRQRAVVHGDIKPSNIQIGVNDEVLLLDFGISKAITLTRNLTNHSLGSPAYCSPERLKRGQVDPHADLWALGVSLYEMVAGLPPYQAERTRSLENLIQSRRPPRALPEDCPTALKSIITKALAAGMERRYPSAAAFEADLRSFLDSKPTQATREKMPVWSVNETLDKRGADKGADTSRRLVKRIRDVNSIVWAANAGIATGLVFFIAVAVTYRHWRDSKPLWAPQDYIHATTGKVNADWQLYQRLQQQRNLFIDRTREPLGAGLLAAANDVLDRYRNSSDPVLEHFDWEKARTCLAHALELNAADRDASGKRAICNGYLQLAQKLPEGARRSFEEAVSYIPQSPDPHLGLARVHIYGDHNAGKAMAEFHAAERLGFALGPREFEQQADGYLYRAEQALRAWQRAVAPAERARYLAIAQRDFERARKLYEPIDGFSNVSRSLEQLYRDEALEQQVQAQRVQAQHNQAKLRAARAKRPRYGRWR